MELLGRLESKDPGKLLPRPLSDLPCTLRQLETERHQQGFCGATEVCLNGAIQVAALDLLISGYAFKVQHERSVALSTQISILTSWAIMASSLFRCFVPGRWLPCSHSQTVDSLTPSRAASPAWESPKRRRERCKRLGKSSGFRIEATMDRRRGTPTLGSLPVDA